MAAKTLDSFFGVEGESRGGPEKGAFHREVNVYLATNEAFDKFCANCDFLVKAEETGSSLWGKRVFCKAERCIT